MEADKDKTPAADAEAAAIVTPGQLLRVAREKSGVSVDEVAHDLHLDRVVVLALEADDFDNLGAPVFVKGYLRSYARLLGLPQDEVVSAFVVPEPQPEEFRTLSAPTELKAGANLINFLLWVALGLVAFIGVAYLLLGDDREPIDEADKGEFVAPAMVPESEPVPEPVSEFVLEAGADFAPEVAEPVTETVEVIAEPAPPVVAEPALLKLTLDFAEECWVEVADTQKRLIYGLEKSGSTVSVEGVPPFKLFLGNVKAVDLRLNDIPYEIPSRARSGNNTARFVINAEDVPGAAAE